MRHLDRLEDAVDAAAEIDRDLRTVLTDDEADVLGRTLAKLRDRTATPHTAAPRTKEASR